MSRQTVLALLAGPLALGIAAAMAADAEQPAAQVVTVVLTEYRFAPDHLIFHRGTTYRLHLENRGAELHEFTAPEFFKAVTVENPAVLVADGHEVVLQPKEIKDVTFVPTKAGKFPLTCADHDWEGMVGEIEID
jgi:uncharacterized cupredoxin-like copper-binding protein